MNLFRSAGALTALALVLSASACDSRSPQPGAGTPYEPGASATSSYPSDSSDARSISKVITGDGDRGLPDLCEGMHTDQERVRVDRFDKPPVGKYYRDPAFGSKVIRITDGGKGSVVKPAYSTVQAWNADESRLLLYQSGGDKSGHYIYDGYTYERQQRLDIVPSDIEEVFWSYLDPDLLFYVSKYSATLGEFRSLNVATGESTLIRSFAEVCPANTAPTVGGDVQMHSYDDDLFGFRCGTGEDQRMIAYRRSTDELVTGKLGKGSPWSPWFSPTPLPSGKRLRLNGATVGTDLTTVEARLDLSSFVEHASSGKTHDGQDALFMTIFDPSPKGCDGDMWKGIGHLVEFNMETGSCRNVVNQRDGYPYTTSGTHISATAWQRPGWVAMSSIGYGNFKYFDEKRPAPALFSEIYLVNTDPDNEVVCRLAQHRSFGKSAESGGYNAYLGEPHATISPSGTRIIFGSDWYDSGSVDSYIIELPAFQRPAGPPDS